MKCSVIQDRLEQCTPSVTFLTGKSFAQQSTTCVRSDQHDKEQKHKNQKYGKMPPKQVETHPWDTLCVDIIGPNTIPRKENKPA